MTLLKLYMTYGRKAVKIKKINVLGMRGYSKPSYVRILFEMAIELYLDNTR